METNAASKVRNAYDIVLGDGDEGLLLQRKIFALQYLESELKTSFKDTADFHSKMERHMTQLSGAEELKRTREALGLTLDQLGKKLRYAKQFVHQMESGSRRLTKKTINFINKHTQKDA